MPDKQDYHGMRWQRLIELLDKATSNEFALFTLRQRRPYLVTLLKRDGFTAEAQEVTALDLDSMAGIDAATTALQRVSETVMHSYARWASLDSSTYDAMSSASAAASFASRGMATGELAIIAGVCAARAAAYAADPNLGPKDQLDRDGRRIWDRAYREQRQWVLARVRRPEDAR